MARSLLAVVAGFLVIVVPLNLVNVVMFEFLARAAQSGLPPSFRGINPVFSFILAAAGGYVAAHPVPATSRCSRLRAGRRHSPADRAHAAGWATPGDSAALVRAGAAGCPGTVRAHGRRRLPRGVPDQAALHRVKAYLFSIPERLVRAVLGLGAGAAREVGEVALPDGRPQQPAVQEPRRHHPAVPHRERRRRGRRLQVVGRTARRFRGQARGGQRR